MVGFDVFFVISSIFLIHNKALNNLGKMFADVHTVTKCKILFFRLLRN